MAGPLIFSNPFFHRYEYVPSVDDEEIDWANDDDEGDDYDEEYEDDYDDDEDDESFPYGVDV